MTWTDIDTILISVGGNWWIFLLHALLIVGVIWILLHKTYFQHERIELTDDEIQARIEERLETYNPEDLVPSKVIKERILNPKILYSKAEKFLTVDYQVCLNLATMNFLDLIGDKEIEERVVEAVEKYGVGSCGPRGFYGTADAHLDLERRLAKFMGTEDAIVYSYGFSCIASAIPAYAKRHDVIFADERVNFAIQKGLCASRSTVKYFKHNSHEDLEVLLMEQQEEDRRNPEKAAKTRRFVIIEGIYMNTGERVELPYYLVLKERYKFRLFIDESISFGTIAHGRGITEFYDIPIEEVDMVMGTLEYAVGSIGGFCCGSKFIIEHQRLSGLGYCFSASQPPLHAVAALKAIDIMEDRPLIFTELAAACKSVSTSLRKLRGMKVQGWDKSPVKHLYLCSSQIGDASQDETLHKISEFCLRSGLAVICSSYIEEEEIYAHKPSLRICVNRSLLQSDIEGAADILQTALDELELSQQTTDNDDHQNNDDDDHETLRQRSREAYRQAQEERGEICRALQQDQGEVHQQPQAETDRAHHQGQSEVLQEQEDVIQQVVESGLEAHQREWDSSDDDDFSSYDDMTISPIRRRTHRE